MQWEGTNWIGIAEDRDKWQAVENVVMNIQIPYNVGDFLMNWRTVSFPRTLFHELVTDLGS